MITIVGSGKVGGAAALFTALRKLSDEILLLDVVQGLPQGEAMDLNHMLSEKGIDANIRGSNDYSEMKGSDIVVVVAGSGRKPGMTRMDLLKINASTGFSRDSIRALVIGEHGENMLPLARYSTVSGIPLTSLLPKQKLDEILQDTRQVAAKVIELKGATVHAPGNAISAIIEAVVRDTKQVIPVATYLDGEYGYSDVTIGVPAVIGKGGVENIIELDLDPNEKELFKKGIESVKTAISGLEL
jgi:malate dehydrogenase